MLLQKVGPANNLIPIAAHPCAVEQYIGRAFIKKHSNQLRDREEFVTGIVNLHGGMVMTRHVEPEGTGSGNLSRSDERWTGYQIAGGEGRQAIL